MMGTRGRRCSSAGFRKSRSPDSNVIFVGDAGCGKATLVSRLCASRAGAGDPAASSAHAGVLAYNFVDAIDPTEADADADDPGVARISFYSLGMTQFGELLDIPLQSGTLEQTVVMIGIDLSKPWRALDSLREWLALVEARVTQRLGQLAEPRRRELQRRVLFGESGADAGVADERPTPAHNFGVPIIVVGCKADTLSLESFDDNRRVQFIQQRLRRECLDYGAALMFVSAKADTNCTLLHQLLWQRLYPSATDALEPQHEHDRVFVPSGWDSPQLIEGLGSWGSDMEFNEAIVAPAHEVTCSTPAVRLPARRLRVTSPLPSLSSPVFHQEPLAPDEAVETEEWSDQSWLTELQKHMEESIAGGRGEGASVVAIGPSPKSANTAVVPARCARSARREPRRRAQRGGRRCCKDGAGQTAEGVVDGSDSTQIGARSSRTCSTRRAIASGAARAAFELPQENWRARCTGHRKRRPEETADCGGTPPPPPHFAFFPFPFAFF